MTPTLDPVAAARLRRLGGDRLLREMIQLFLQLGPERLAGARAADLSVAERACHSLKSAAGNLGAQELQATAGVAEAAAATGDAAALRTELDALGAAYDRAATELKRVLSELEP